MGAAASPPRTMAASLRLLCWLLLAGSTASARRGGKTGKRRAHKRAHDAHWADRIGQGTRLYGEGRLAEAAAAYGRAIEADPTQAKGYFNLGVCQAAMGLREDAVATYTTATRRDPRYINAWFNGATELKELGRLEEAVASYQRVVALSPTDADALGNLAVCRQRQRRLPEAEAESRRAVDLNPRASGHL